jgi:hypothetical protein
MKRTTHFRMCAAFALQNTSSQGSVPRSGERRGEFSKPGPAGDGAPRPPRGRRGAGETFRAGFETTNVLRLFSFAIMAIARSKIPCG